MDMPFSEHIKCLRENEGMSQSELAREIGINRSTLNHWEQGNSIPKIDKVLPICCALSISPNEFFRFFEGRDA